MTDFTCTSPSILRGPVPLSHLLLRNFVRNGYCAVDATCGNGHDTLLLAQLVGDCGHVWGFDIQSEAIAATTHRLAEEGLLHRATLLNTGHEQLGRHVSAPLHAVVFNLGYLPGGDRSIITRPQTTLPAVKQSLHLLTPGGIILVTVYPGHNGGAGEQSAIEAWTADLDPHAAYCWRMGQLNVSMSAPLLIVIQKTR